MPYKPRERAARFRANYKITRNRYAWARIAWGTVALMFYPDDEAIEAPEEIEGVQSEAPTEPGPTIRFVIKKNSVTRSMTLDLTMLTAEELRCLKQVFDLGFAEAIPVAELRDKEAQRAHAQGDDSNSRIYRPVPQFVVRERPGGQHPEGVRDGPEGLPSGDGDGLPGDGVRATSNDVADSEPEHRPAQDNGA